MFNLSWRRYFYSSMEYWRVNFNRMFLFKKLIFILLKNTCKYWSKSFQGHTGHIHDLCEILIGRFHLLLTGSSDFSVRVCLNIFFQANKNKVLNLVMGYCYRNMLMYIFVSKWNSFNMCIIIFKNNLLWYWYGYYIYCSITKITNTSKW